MYKLLSVFGLIGAASAYSVNGHMAVANIAQDLLTTNNPTVLAAAVAELRPLQEFDPDLVYRENMYPFIECSTFADDIKYHGGAWQSDFHFINFPFIDQAGKTTADYPGSTDIKTRNITEAIKNSVDWLSGKNGDAYQSSYFYDFIANRLYPGNPAVARSYALRLLIHYLGDIAQPFHTTARFSDAYPEGDKGANLFPIPYHYEADELHAVWDKGVYSLRGNIARPFTQSTYDAFQTKTINPYMATYKYSLTDTTVANRDIDAWAAQAFEEAKTMYTGVTENEVIPQSYLDISVPKVENYITLGGYRSAWIMEYIYGNVNARPTFLA